MNIERLVAYKWLKMVEALVLIIVGVVFACFYNNGDFASAVGYGFAVVLLVYGIIEIVGSLLLKRSVFSSEIILGLIIIAVAVMLLVYSGKLSDNPGEFNALITWFFGIFIAGYAIVLVASGIMEIVPKKDEKKRLPLGILELVVAAALIALDVVLWVFGFKEESATNPVLVLIIAVSLILMGLIAIGNVALAAKTQKIFQQSNENLPQKNPESTAPQKNEKEKKEKKKASESKQLEVFDATKALENKDEDSDK